MKLYNCLYNYSTGFSNKKLSAIAILFFASVIAVGMHYHEMWRDELEVYSVLTNSGDILLKGDISYMVYNSLLKLFLLISGSEAMFQFFHFIVIVSAIYIFLSFSSINNIQKVLFAFSYFLIYDYGIIARFYSFMILLIFLIVYFISKIPSLRSAIKTHTSFLYIVIVVLILILANHSVISLTAAAGLSVYLILTVLNLYSNNNHFKFSEVFSFKKKYDSHAMLNYGALILFVVGWLIILSSDIFITLKIAHFKSGVKLDYAPFFMNFRAIWNSYFPVFDLNSDVDFWNSNIINFPITFPRGYNLEYLVNFSNILAIILSFSIIFIISVKFASRPIVLITFLFITILFLFFLEELKIYYVRYQGPLFIGFMYCYWLYCNTEEQVNLKFFNKIAIHFNKDFYNNFRKLFYPLLYLMLIAQIFSAFYAFGMDVKYKFTYSQEAAKYILDNKLNKTHVMVGSEDFIVESIAAHTHTKIFFTEIKHFNYFWEPFKKERRTDYLPIRDILSSCINFTENQHRKVLLILTIPLPDENDIPVIETMITDKTKVKFLKAFCGKSIVPDEQFYLYECTNVK